MEKNDVSIETPKRTIANEVIVRFGERLKEAMKGESNYSLAKRSGLSERVIRQYLKGASYPTLDNLVSLSVSTNTPIEWLAIGSITNNSPVSDNELNNIQSNSLLQKWIDIFNIMNETDKSTALGNLMASGYKQLLINPQQEEPRLSKFKQIIMNLLLELNEEDAKEILSNIGNRRSAHQPVQKQA